jgi:hypothetical protein
MTDDKFIKDGLPICPIDVPNIYARGDLADMVAPLWTAAGIEHDCYSVSRHNTLMMLADPDRHGEALRLVQKVLVEEIRPTPAALPPGVDVDELRRQVQETLARLDGEIV